MRTEQCYCVIEAAKTGSFTKAAANLYLKQPSLRANIDKLEAELGQPLFNRAKSGVSLTEFGEWCYPYIVSIIETYEMMKKKNVIEDENPLLIGATRIFDDVLGKSYNLYEVQQTGKKCVFYSAVIYEEIVKRIIDHQLDIGLISYFPILWDENQWIQSQLGKKFEKLDLCLFPVMALMSKNHPLSNCKYITLEKLEKYLLVFFNNSGTYVLDVINHELKDKNIKLHISRVADERLLYKYLLEENAISFTIEQASGSYPESLKCIAMDERFVQKAAALVPKGRLDDNIKTYINIIKTLINSY